VSAAPLLAARGAARRFGSRLALAPTDLELRDGEVLALVGPNGAGKSTLLTLLAGALEPTEGRVERRPGARIGWMPQRPAHYGRLSARENIELFARLQHEPEPERAAAGLLALCELPAEERPSGELSLGNRQRLNLALALLGDPHALLLDEPTASLDPRQRARLWATAAALRDQGGSVVLVTQHADDLEHLADRVGVLVEGELRFLGSYAEYTAGEARALLA
jgi:ABC-2 type transport system ATP-binding protein